MVLLISLSSLFIPLFIQYHVFPFFISVPISPTDFPIDAIIYFLMYFPFDLPRYTKCGFPFLSYSCVFLCPYLCPSSFPPLFSIYFLIYVLFLSLFSIQFPIHVLFVSLSLCPYSFVYLFPYSFFYLFPYVFPLFISLFVYLFMSD